MEREELFEGQPAEKAGRKRSGHGVSTIITYKSYE
jgi:hypothetical protein